MKKFFSIIALFFLYSCVTTQSITAPGKITETFNIPGSKNELYIKANQWMVKTFNNAKSVIQFQDKEAGKIMGKYLMHNYSFTGLYGTQSTSDIYALISPSLPTPNRS